MKRSYIDALFVLSAAILPFATKIFVLLFGYTGYAPQSLYKLFQITVPCGWRWKEGKRRMNIFWPIHEPLPRLKVFGVATIISILLSATAIAALQFLIPLFHLEPNTIRAGLDERFSVGPIGAIAVVLFLSFANSALEELHFRVWLDGSLSKIYNNFVGISVSAIAFGCMHGLIFFGLPDFPLTLITLAIIGLIIAGICWSILRRAPGGIHAAWWSHGLTDFILLGWGLVWLGYM